MSEFPWSKIVVLSLTLAPSAAAVSYQTPQDTTQVSADTTQPPQLRPIPASEVILRSDSLSEELRALDEILTARSDIADLDSLLAEVASPIADLTARSDSGSLATASARVLEDLETRLERFHTDVAGWLQTAELSVQELDSVRLRLQETRSLWELTRDSLDAQVPETVQARIAGVFQALDSSEVQLTDRGNALITLEGSLSEQRGIIAETLERIRAARTQRRQALFVAEQPPLWRSFQARDSTEAALGTDLGDTWNRDLATLRDFAVDNSGILWVRGVLFVLLAAGLVRLRNRDFDGTADDDGVIAGAAGILAAPISAAFLISLLTTSFFHPQAPQAVREFVALLYLLPLWRLTPHVVPGALHRAAYGLLCLFLLERIESFVEVRTLIDRLSQLGLTTAVLVGLIWFLRPGGAAISFEGGRWWRAFLTAVRGGVLVLAGAGVANVVGAVNLSELITSAVLVGFTAAYLLFAGVLVVRAAVRLVLRAPFAQRLGSVRRNAKLIAQRVDGFIPLVALAWWLSVVLDLFRVRDVAVTGFRTIVDVSLSLGSVSVSVGDMLAFAFVVWVTFQISRFIRFVLQEDVLPRVDLPRGVAATVMTLSNYVLLTIGFVFAAAAAGVDLTQITLLAGALGVGIGFGLQNVVNNFVSGLIMIFERPIQVGDTIQIDPLIGVVQRIGIRASVVRTFDGADVIVPNGDLIAGQVVNWSLSDRVRRITLQVGVAYGTDPQRVLDLLVHVAKQDDGVLSGPAPEARFLGFGDSALNFSLWVWSKLDEWISVETRLNVAVNTALNDAGIEIPFPQRDLHLRSANGAALPPVDSLRESADDREATSRPTGPD